MMNYMDVRTNEDIYKAKAQFRKETAAQPFEQKLLTVVQMQIRAAHMAESSGRSCSKPWHSDDPARLKKIASYR